MKYGTVWKSVLALAAALLLTVSSGSAKAHMIFSDGYAAIEDSSAVLAEGTTVNVVITRGVAAPADFDALSGLSAADVEYYGAVSVGEDGTYLIEFLPDEPGTYTVYAGSALFDEVRTYQVCYIDKTRFLSAAAALLACTTDAAFEEVLSNQKTALGLTDAVFDAVDFATLAPIARNSLEGASADDYERIIQTAETSALAALLNEEKVSEITAYSALTNLDENEYFAEDLGSAITAYVSGKGIADCEELEQLLSEAVVLANVQKRSPSVLSRVLKANAGLLGINVSAVTTALCNEMAGRAFADIHAVKDFIDSYQSATGGGSGISGGGGSGGGSLGGGTSSGNFFSGSTASVPADAEAAFEFENPFTDMEGCEWAIDSVKQLYYRSVINGKEAGKFFPNDPITREEFVKIITVALKMNLVDETIPFDDVEETAWYAPYVRTAYIAQITNGVSERVFGTGTNITREDLCVMVCRGVQAGDFSITAVSEAEMNFADTEEISDYAEASVKALCGAGIVSGADGYFRPKDPATRAEAAKIVNMVMHNIGI